MSLNLIKVDLGIDYIDLICKKIKYLARDFEKVFFISGNRRPIYFLERVLDLDTCLKVNFFTIEDFIKFLVINFSETIPYFHSQIERDLFFLNLIKDFKNLYENFGKEDSKVFPLSKRVGRLFDEIDKHLL